MVSYERMSGISRTLPAPASGGGVAPPGTPTTAPPAAVDQQEDEDDELTGEDKKRLERTIDLGNEDELQRFHQFRNDVEKLIDQYYGGNSVNN